MGARVLDVLVHLVLAVPALLLTPEANLRPVTALTVWWATIVAYEVGFTLAFGATLGKLATGIRIVELDRIGRCSARAAVRRACVDSLLEIIPVIGWISLAGGLGETLSRGAPDRAGGTIVVRKHAVLPIRKQDLPGYADHLRPPRIGPHGRIGDPDVRIRARFRRFNDSPVLVAATGAAALAWMTFLDTPGQVILLVLAWMTVFIVDETLRIARSGATAGHRMAGLIVYSPRTGGPPTMGRSLLRAIIVAVSAYTIIGFVLVFVSIVMMRTSRTGRSLHDLAAGTWVVADPGLDPEVSRQRAMQVRTGEVA